jgi:flagellar hook-associated protein 2
VNGRAAGADLECDRRRTRHADASGVSNVALKCAAGRHRQHQTVVEATTPSSGSVARIRARKSAGVEHLHQLQDVKITFTRARRPRGPSHPDRGHRQRRHHRQRASFVDAYNKLKTLIDGLASPGDPTKGVAAGIFANDPA